MTIRLWDGIDDLNLLVGADFPDADEDALWRCADAWTRAAAELRRLAPDAVEAGSKVLEVLGGDAGLAFVTAWREFADDHDGLVGRLARACDELAAACDRTAVEVEYAKIQYIAALVVLGATIASLVATIWAGGVSAAGIPVAVAAAQVTIRLVLMRLLTGVVLGAGVNVAIDLVAQSIQRTQGHRDGWDWSLTARAAQDGAVYGVAGAGVVLAGGRLAPGLLATPAGLLAVAGATGLVGGIAAPLVHGERPTARDVLLAMSSGLVGGLGPDLPRGRVAHGPVLAAIEVPDPALPQLGGGVRPVHPADGAPGRDFGTDGVASNVAALADVGPELVGSAVREGSSRRPDVAAPVSPSHPTDGRAPVAAPPSGGSPPLAPPAAPPPAGPPAAAPVLLPLGPAPAGTAPAGAVPSGTAPAGTAQAGTAPPGSALPAVAPAVPPPAAPPPVPPAGGAPAAVPGPSAASAASGPSAPSGSSGPLGAPPMAAVSVAVPPAPVVGAGPTSSLDATDGGPGPTPGEAAPPIEWALTDAEAVALVRANAFATPAGYGFYAVDDEVRHFARAVRPADGLVTLDLHGSPHGFQIDLELISPAQLVLALRELIADATIVLPEGHGIKLLSCDTAAGGPRSPAAQLAQALGVPVIAPDLPVWTTMDGQELVANPVVVDGFILPADPPDGSWHRFSPDGTTTLLGPTFDGAAGRSAERGLTDHAPRGPDPGPAELVAGDGGDARLVGAEHATIDAHKVTAYALDPDHPVGRHKAKVFLAVLGFDQSNAHQLVEQLREGVRAHAPVAGVSDRFGRRFTVDIEVAGPRGHATVRTGWIYDPGSGTPRLTTLFVR